MGQQNGEVRIIENKTSIEICKSEKGLHIFDFSGFGPILDEFDLVLGHSKAVGWENVSEVFDSVYMEKAFVSASIQVILSESLEYVSNTLSVLVKIAWIYKDVVQVDEDLNIKEVGEDIVHEALKHC